MKALIIEDEPMAAKRISRIIAEDFPDIEVVGTIDSVSSAVEYLSHDMPDIIFMDVRLSDGECFEIFRQVNVKANVIMTTAYDSYAVKAFEAGSIDYLLKPIDQNALARAVNRCRKNISAVDSTKIMEALESLMPAGKNPNGGGQQTLQEPIYLEGRRHDNSCGDRRYSIFHFRRKGQLHRVSCRAEICY